MSEAEQVEQPKRASDYLHEESDNYKQFLSTRLKAGDEGGADGLAVAAALLRGFAVLARFQERALELAVAAASARQLTAEDLEKILKAAEQAESKDLAAI